MSADRWTCCPKCKYKDPDADPDAEYYGPARVDIDVHQTEPKFRISFWCTECGWSHVFTEKDIP